MKLPHLVTLLLELWDRVSKGIGNHCTTFPFSCRRSHDIFRKWKSEAQNKEYLRVNHVMGLTPYREKRHQLFRWPQNDISSKLFSSRLV
jgi:hypothetical protein